MGTNDRLTALDASFLHLEKGGRAHMHVAAVFRFEGDPPDYEDLVEHVVRRLDLVPRYRQRLAEVPLGQGRPVWVDDPHFNPRYHIRHTALPAPGDDDQLKRLAGRVFAQELDRSKPLWEIWLVEGLQDGFALVSKTHHALVDGISGVDVTTVIFDLAPDPAPVPTALQPWVPRPAPTPAQLLAAAWLERATVPREIARGVRAVLRGPRQVAAGVRDAASALAAFALPGLAGAPPTPLNVRIGPHRRFEWVDGDLARFKAIKDALGGTVNDAVLTAVTGALGRWLRRRGVDTDGLVLRAMVPVSVRADVEQGALGNRVAAMWAPLPVGLEDPAEAFAAVHDAMGELKASGQAVGAQVLTQLADFAPPTVLSQAARLQSRQRAFNVTVTNVPGPQMPLYVLGRRLRALYPVVPLSERTALGVAIMSYAGRLGFGLLGDFDALPDLPRLARDLEDAIDALAAAAGTDPAPPRGPRPRPRTAAASATS